MGVVRFTIDERGVATAVLDSPANRNALSRAVIGGVAEALDQAEANRARAFVLTHEGTAFCAGADLRERSDGSPDSGPMVDVLRRLMTSSFPTIAAVKGAVRAGGIGLMASCDLVVVDAAVDFAFTEVRIGVAAAIISVPILRRANASALRAAFLTGERFGAEEARSAGLVTHVCDGADAVDAAVARLVGGVLAGAPGAVAATKRLLSVVPDLPLADAFPAMQVLSESLFAAEEGREGIAAFLEKRPPSWAAGSR